MTKWEDNQLSDGAGLRVPPEEETSTRGRITTGSAGIPQLTEDRFPAPQVTDLELLTDRERQVLALLADGPSNRAIARKLGIAERTVKAHLTNLMRKLGIESRLEAALLANLRSNEINPLGHCP